MNKFIFINGEDILVFNVVAEFSHQSSINSWGSTICMLITNNDKPFMLQNRNNTKDTELDGLYVICQASTNLNMFVKFNGCSSKILVPENIQAISNFFRCNAEKYLPLIKDKLVHIANLIEIPDIWYGNKPVLLQVTPKALKSIIGCPEVLWPFLQDEDPLKIESILKVYRLKGGTETYPLDIRLVDKYLLFGERNIRVYRGTCVVYLSNNDESQHASKLVYNDGHGQQTSISRDLNIFDTGLCYELR